MRKTVFTVLTAFMLCAAASVHAQSSLAGRVYYNPNILADEMDRLFSEADGKVAEAKEEARAKAEKEKGRQLTADELAQLDKKVEEAQELMKAMKKGVKTGISIEFTNDAEMVMKTDMRIDDEVMKAAGISWVKRKAMKAALAIMPKSEKGTYILQGRTVIAQEKGTGERDTLTLSADGKQLSGMMDQKTPFVLTRIK